MCRTAVGFVTQVAVVGVWGDSSSSSLVVRVLAEQVAGTVQEIEALRVAEVQMRVEAGFAFGVRYDGQDLRQVVA